MCGPRRVHRRTHGRARSGRLADAQRAARRGRPARRRRPASAAAAAHDAGPGRSVVQEQPVRRPDRASWSTPGPAGAGSTRGSRYRSRSASSARCGCPSTSAGLWLLDCSSTASRSAGDPKGVAISDAAGTSGPPAHIERSTLLGSSRFFELELASESIFTGTVRSSARQTGCVRFCFVPGARRRRASTAASRPSRSHASRPSVARQLGATAACLPVESSDRGRDRALARARTLRCRRSTAAPTTPSCDAPARRQIRTGPRTAPRWACSACSSSPSARPTSGCVSTSTCPIGLEAGLIYVT